MAAVSGLSPREWSALLSVLAFTGVAWRCIGSFPILSSLERALAGILLAGLVLAAVGTYNLDRANAPASGVVFYVIALRLVVLFLVWKWPKWTGRTGTIRERLHRHP